MAKIIRSSAASGLHMDKKKEQTILTLDNPASMIPPKEVVQLYVPRTIHGVYDFNVFDSALSSNKNVLIEGPTGSAKTTAVRAYAAARGYPFYSIPSNVGIEPTQLFGKMRHSNGEWVFQDGPVTALIRHSTTGPAVLLINEINFMPPRIATAIFSLLDNRRQIALLDNDGEVLTAGQLLIVADMNPGYQGTRELNHALRNRFPYKILWDYDTKIEEQLVSGSTILNIASKLRKSQSQGDFETPVSTNMLQEFEAIVFEHGLDFAIANFVNTFESDCRSAIQEVFNLDRPNLENDYRKEENLEEEEEIELPDFNSLTLDEIKQWMQDHYEIVEEINNWHLQSGTYEDTTDKSPYTVANSNDKDVLITHLYGPYDIKESDPLEDDDDDDLDELDDNVISKTKMGQTFDADISISTPTTPVNAGWSVSNKARPWENTK